MEGGGVQFEDLACFSGMNGIARAEASVGSHHAEVLTVKRQGGAAIIID
jgi:hypothetical protein